MPRPITNKRQIQKGWKYRPGKSINFSGTGVAKPFSTVGSIKSGKCKMYFFETEPRQNYSFCFENLSQVVQKYMDSAWYKMKHRKTCFPRRNSVGRLLISATRIRHRGVHILCSRQRKFTYNFPYYEELHKGAWWCNVHSSMYFEFLTEFQKILLVTLHQTLNWGLKVWFETFSGLVCTGL
jgi:hypothetical protein